jgi:hypothetical protein
MDYLTIAASIVTSTLVPLFQTFGTKALEEVGKKTGEEVFDNRQTILEKVKDLFAGDDLITLNLLGKYPDNEDIQKEVTEKLETKLKDRPEIATSLEQINQRIVEIENIDITKSKLLNRIKMARDSERKVTIKNKGIEGSEVENIFEET